MIGRNMVRPRAIEKFWSLVEKTPYCWRWLGKPASPEPAGRMVRFSWEIHNGPIPEGQIVRHVVCDNNRCVRPDHLQLGTHEDNRNDMYRHGRQWPAGRRGPHCAVTMNAARVQDIRRRWDTSSSASTAPLRSAALRTRRSRPAPS